MASVRGVEDVYDLQQCLYDVKDCYFDGKKAAGKRSGDLLYLDMLDRDPNQVAEYLEKGCVNT